MKKHSLLCLFLSASLAASPVLTAYGALGPGDSMRSVPEGVSEEVWNRLNDQTIEFDEISDLLKYFNPDLNAGLASGADSLNGVQNTYDEMRIYVKDLNNRAKNLRDSGGTDSQSGMVEYMTLKGTSDAYSKAADDMKPVLTRFKKSFDTGTDQAVKTMSAAVSQIMIGYNSAQANRALLQKLLDTNNAAYEAQKLEFQQGMATEADLLASEKEVLSAQSSLIQLDHTIDNLRRMLGLMTGYSADATPQVGQIPQMDLAVFSSLDLEGDTQKAIGNNYDLISLRRAKSDGTTTGMSIKDAKVSQATQEISIQMQSLYRGVMQAKTAYEAACTSYEKAVLIGGKSDRALQLGMMNRVTYLQSQMALLQAEGTKQSAYNSLYQAYDAYQWAVNGIIQSSGQ